MGKLKDLFLKDVNPEDEGGLKSNLDCIVKFRCENVFKIMF